MARVLIIDDEKLARFTLRKILEQAGHSVVEAGNGTDGITLYRTLPTDLVITDIIMPGKEGIETITELRHEFPDVRILAMSGGGRSGNLDFLKLAVDRGAHAILAKPFSRDELLAALDKVLPR